MQRVIPNCCWLFSALGFHRSYFITGEECGENPNGTQATAVPQFVLRLFILHPFFYTVYFFMAVLACPFTGWLCFVNQSDHWWYLASGFHGSYFLNDEEYCENPLALDWHSFNLKKFILIAIKCNYSRLQAIVNFKL